jgi:NAD(P)-dependent dehydrogenase (short-subunit alcohol dehydrogenase family)
MGNAHQQFDGPAQAAAAAFLASDAITGTALLVDGGWATIDGAPSGLTEPHRDEC